ncbi:DUF1127 domain-containing protein [Mesorhizobium sp.]|jgi:uncharacterized protein YjiS (DUF1127 family)|uniref:DUF1127 domain-containing protein n=1 Tax=Mesorhizobium sp. TaxID=1871066 RepID=UPI003563BD6C
MTTTLRAMLAGIGRGWRHRRDRRHLAAMPDFMLKDIGISRCDIERVTTHGEIGRLDAVSV